MMFTTKALVSATLLAGSAMAQTSSVGDAQCTRSYASLLKGAPTPDAQLAKALTSYASQAASSLSGSDATAVTNPLAIATQVCDFSSGLPSSLQSDFDAYVTKVISYVSASSSEIDAVVTNCLATGKEGEAYTSVINSFAAHTGPLCDASGGPATGTTPAPTGSATDANGEPTSSPSQGAAALPTAVYGGVAAAAGLLGVVAML
ncbi:hypothetical protein F4808DRAFT_112841 [Astrocystis sublimbata]|nr:hypothetical protein F4808DRAFT_112841 [Astrocystis sublimbata]